MPSPKDGSPGSIVAPAAPDPAKDADKADPGEVEKTKQAERETGKGKYGEQPAKPYKKPSNSEEAKDKSSWIEIVLIDEENNPVAGQKYRVKLPDDTVAEGTLDSDGFARLDVQPGTCQVTFPDLDQDAWEKA